MDAREQRHRRALVDGVPEPQERGVGVGHHRVATGDFPRRHVPTVAFRRERGEFALRLFTATGCREHEGVRFADAGLRGCVGESTRRVRERGVTVAR